MRGSIKAGLGADDYVIAVALLTQWAVTAMTIFGAVAGGQGDSLENLLLHREEGRHYARILFAGTIMFAVTISLIKVSTLLLYKRLFITPRFCQACNGSMFSSKPISSSWELPSHTTGHSVIDYPVFLLSLAAINTTFDLIVVCLPLFVISRLHLDKRRKWAVAGIFLLGGFCVVASVVRLHYFVQLKNVPKGAKSPYTRIVVYLAIWTFIECCTSIVAACLPTLAPLFRGNGRLDSLIRSVRSLLSLRSDASKGSSDTDGSSRNDRPNGNAWRELTSNPNHKTYVSKGEDLNPEDKRELLTNSRSIQVQTSLRSEVDVARKS
ncbi:MAG: hypothetical protein Q9208_006776 [Pyrenodesmia sp. 3 TL-2023]